MSDPEKEERHEEKGEKGKGEKGGGGAPHSASSVALERTIWATAIAFHRYVIGRAAMRRPLSDDEFAAAAMRGVCSMMEGFRAHLDDLREAPGTWNDMRTIKLHCIPHDWADAVELGSRIDLYDPTEGSAKH